MLKVDDVATRHGRSAEVFDACSQHRTCYCLILEVAMVAETPKA